MGHIDHIGTAPRVHQNYPAKSGQVVPYVKTTMCLVVKKHIIKNS